MNNVDNIIDIIFTHWDKIVLAISIFCFFINEIFKSSIRKNEIAFSLTHNEVIKAISNYIESYYQYKISMRDIPIEYLNSNFPPKAMDEIATVPLDRLKYCDFKLSLYLTKSAYSQYKKITERANYLNARLHIILNDREKDIKHANQYSKEYKSFVEDTKVLLDIVLKNTKELIWNQHKNKTSLFSKRNREKCVSKQKQTNDKQISDLLYTITTLQATINEKTKTIQALEEANKRMNGELTMLKNERNIR